MPAARLDPAPQLEPYFITGHHDDVAGILRSYGAVNPGRVPAVQYLSSIALLVGTIDAVLAGALAGLACDATGVGRAAAIVVGAGVAVIVLAALVLVTIRRVNRTWRAIPRFPS
jgi:hypothetical protein